MKVNKKWMKNMLEGMVYMQQHNQVAGIVSSNICGGFGLEDLRSKGDTSPGVVENNQAKLPWDFQIQTDKVLMANQPDIQDKFTVTSREGRS